MLQTIRDRTQGWFTWVIVIFICFTFALWGAHNFSSGSNDGDTVAEVDGTKISRQALSSFYRQLQQQHGPAGSLDESAEKQLQEKALEQLIISQSMVKSTIAEGFRISNKQIDALLLTIPLFWEDGQFSPQRYQQIVNSQFASEKNFLADLKNQMLVNQVQSGFVNSNFFLPRDEEALIKIIKQKRDLGFVTIPAKQFMTAVTIASDEIDAYYNKHKDNFKIPEQASFEYIELSVPAIAKAEAISSQPIESPEQVFLVKSEKLENLSYAYPNSLTEVAKELDLPIQHTDYLTQQGGQSTGIGANAKVRAAAFSDDVLHGGYNSDVITLDDQTQVVLRLKEYKPADFQPLSAVRAQIVALLTQKKAQQKAEQLGKKVLQQLQSGSSSDVVANDNHWIWQEKAGVMRDNKDLNKVVLNQAFHLPKPTSATKQSVAGVALPTGDYALVKVTRVVDGDAATISSTEQEAMREEIALAYGQLDYELYVRGLISKAKIKRKLGTEQTESS